MRPKGAGDLRHAVRFERRSGTPDGYGNDQGDWTPLIARRAASLQPTRGGELVIAQRLQGESSWDLWVRYDSATRGVMAGDQVVDLHDDTRIFAVRFAQDMTGRKIWLLMQLTLGEAT